MKRKGATTLRKFGLERVGRVPWGTHLCQFYETKQDLIDILIPYFTEGLHNNEFCMWITSPPLEAEEAKQALEEAVPELDQYVRSGQIEILPYTEWYLVGGAFDSGRVLQGWVSKEKAALNCGFDGLRLTGNTFWLERNDWRAFTEYEEEVNNAIANHRMIAVCTYSLAKCNAGEVIDVVKNHQFALIQRAGKWELIESSETKRIQRDLLRSEKKYSALYSSMTEGVAIHDVVYDSSGTAVDYVVTDVNPSYEKITGLSKKEAIGKRASELYGTGRPPYLDVFAKVASSRKPESFETYFPPMQKHFSISVFSPAKGKFTTVFHDITERKRAEQELFDALNASQRRQSEVSALLKASEAVLKNREFKQAARAIFDSCKELLGAAAGYVALLSKEEGQNEVLFLDSGGLPCKVDPSLPMPIRGLRAEAYRSGKVVYSNDFLKSEWMSLMPEGHVALENVLFAPLIIDKKTVGIIGLANKPDGFTEWDAMMALAFGGIASVALINSRTLETLEENEKLLKAHSERLEELVEERTRQLRDAERLAAIGQTAGMVGHDIRNPLQSIIGDVYLAKKDLDLLPSGKEKESLQESIEAIEKQTEYINKIVLDLQDFAKPLNPLAEETDVQRLIAELLVRNGLPENIHTEAKVEIGAEKIIADSAYLKRIIGNLISNAVQAMPNGGNLIIHVYREADDIMVTVEDTGMGIPDEVKPKLFQPLFTTKSKGQGFGLAVVKRLTEALHGTIAFESQEGKGTKFTLRFIAPKPGFFSSKHP